MEGKSLFVTLKVFQIERLLLKLEKKFFFVYKCLKKLSGKIREEKREKLTAINKLGSRVSVKILQFFKLQFVLFLSINTWIDFIAFSVFAC